MMNLYQQFFSRFPYMSLPLIGQIIFMAVFIAAIAWVFRDCSGPFYERMSSIPLKDEE